MPSVQGYGAIPGHESSGDILVKMLEAGILGNNEYTKQQQDRADKLKEFDQKQQELDTAKESTRLLRQQQMWQSIAESGQRAKENAINQYIRSGGTYDDAIKNGIGDKEMKAAISTAAGYPNGKLSDDDLKEVETRLGPGAASWFTSADTSSSGGGRKDFTPADAPGTPGGNAIAQAKAAGSNSAGLAALGGAGGLGLLLNAMNKNPLGNALGNAGKAIGNLGSRTVGGWGSVPTAPSTGLNAADPEARAALARFTAPGAGEIGAADLGALGPLAEILGSGAAGWGAGRAIGGMNVGGQSVDQRIQGAMTPLFNQGQQPSANTLNPAVLAFLSQQAGNLPQGQ